METACITGSFGDEFDSAVAGLVDSGLFDYHQARQIVAAELDSESVVRAPDWRVTLARVRAANADRAIARATQDAQELGVPEAALRTARGLPLA